jgi:hypothetical protein
MNKTYHIGGYELWKKSSGAAELNCVTTGYEPVKIRPSARIIVR